MKKALPVGIALIAVALGAAPVLAAHVSLADESGATSQTMSASTEVDQASTR